MRKYTKPVCVITCDLIKSRQLSERDTIQKKIKKTITKINQQHANRLIANFNFTLGDEFQGVLKNLADSYSIISEIQNKLHGIKIAFGVGKGTISTPISSLPTEMDGIAFHLSREALTIAKKKTRIVYRTGDTTLDEEINNLVTLILIIKESWTPRQREILDYYNKSANLSKVATALKVSYQFVSKIVRTTHWHAVRSAEQLLSKKLVEQ